MNPEQSITFDLSTHEQHRNLPQLETFNCQVTIKFYDHGNDEYSCVLNGVDVIFEKSSKENTLSNLYNHLKTAMQRREASAKSRGFDAFEYKLSNLRASNDESIFKHVEIRNSLKIN